MRIPRRRGSHATVGRKQVDNKITSKTQIAGGCGFRVEDGGPLTVGRKKVEN